MDAQIQFSAPCERNKQPILDVLRKEFEQCQTILEIGSGTGQHVVHFARALTHLQWQPTDLAAQLPALTARISAEAPQNVKAAEPLDVLTQSGFGRFDGIYSANTLHIMSWEAVQAFFCVVGQTLNPAGRLCVYGPFLYQDVETSPGNLTFDQLLRDRDPLSGLRSFEAIDELAAEQALVLQADHAMPANNRLLVWQRTDPGQGDQERIF